MIDLIAVFTTGGVILFYQTFNPKIGKNVLQRLIQDNIAKEKDELAVKIDAYSVEYIKAQQQGLIFVIATQSFLKIQKIGLLLEMVKSAYLEQIYPELVIEQNIVKSIPDFKEAFENTINEWNRQNLKKKGDGNVPKNFYQTKKGKEIQNTTQKDNVKAQSQAEKQIQAQKKSRSNNRGSFVEEEQEEEEKEDMTEEEKEMYARRKMLEKNFKKSGSQVKSPTRIEEKSEPRQRQQRESQKQKFTKKDLEKFDKSQVKDKELDFERMKQEYLGDDDKPIATQFIDSEEESSDEEEQPKKSGFFAKLTNSVKLMTGNKIIDEADLEPVLEQFKEHLAGKNVAEEMAVKIVDSVKINMLNTKSTAFTSLNKLVKESLNSALNKILTPKRNIDPIAEALRARERGKPYVITFIGVNGVGKSTNLAKVAYLFKNQGFKVMLAACDNFRGGAVEQIKTHGRCLGVPVFEKGYGNDAADIAFEAIREAQLKKYEIVLIDTAGRMQDNEPLMRQLSKLVVMNKPDLIIFIGEALVGNDGIDQLRKFNKALIDLSPSNNVREIDAVILSKFDTVDDKVGAAITMTYSSGKPILFCGVGQKYTHLRKLNQRTVVHALLN